MEFLAGEVFGAVLVELFEDLFERADQSNSERLAAISDPGATLLMLLVVHSSRDWRWGLGGSSPPAAFS